VKKSHLVATLAACVGLLVSGSLGWAQQLPAVHPSRAPQRAPVIALLDVSYIFKNYTRFKAMMSEMKADVDRAEAAVKKERERLMGAAERLKELRQGTPDYKTLEESLTKESAEVQARIQLQKKEFLQKEARIYYMVYQEISQEADYYCRNNGIDMVLRFNGDPVDVDKPDDVLRDINKPVIWYAKDRDITPIILDALNRRVMTPQAQPAFPNADRGNGVGVPFPR